MKQIRLGLNLSTKKTRKSELLDEMERVVPRKALVQIIESHWPKSKTGRQPFAKERARPVSRPVPGSASPANGPETPPFRNT